MKNMFERCHLGSVVIRNAYVFDPNYMLNESSATLETKVQKLLLISLNIINTTTAQKTLKQYMNILRNEKERFLSFEASQRLEKFFFPLYHYKAILKSLHLFLN